jgi:hypothetical protein
LREVVEHVFVDLGSRTCSSLEELEARAEQFASVARSKAFGKTPQVAWKNAEQIEKKWARYGAFVLIAVGGLAYFLGIYFLPHLEDAWPPDEGRKRNVRT